MANIIQTFPAGSSGGSSTEWLSGLRFKNLGNSFTQEQATALANGDFSDFWNGDYWVDETQNIIWRIVDNTGIFRKRGDTTPKFDSPSLVIMPDNVLYPASPDSYTGKYMRTTDTVNGGYVATRYFTVFRPIVKTIFENFFGSGHIATHEEYVNNSVNNGTVTACNWESCTVELPSETQLFGHIIHSAYTNGKSNGFNIGSAWGQFRLFNLAPYMVISDNVFWLRNVVDGTHFGSFRPNGTAGWNSSSAVGPGLRPYGVLV